MLFLVSVLAYLACSAPQVPVLESPVRLPLLALCLIGAPAFWLGVQALFDDRFERIRAHHVLALAAGLVLGGWMVIGEGSPHGRIGEFLFRGLGLALTAHALFTVVRDFRQDLLDIRIAVRRGFLVVVGLYTVGFLLIEPLAQNSEYAEALRVLHFTAIAVLALIGALVFTEARWAILLSNTSASSDFMPALQQTPLPVGVGRDEGRKLTHRLVPALMKMLEQERVYHRAGISISSLANELGTSEHTLRRVINGQLGYRNFNDLLNRYRIDEAKHRLRAEPQVPILTIALDAGFGSIGPFNRTFKQLTGHTPSAWRAAPPADLPNPRN
jgi:AraC-like DNA-binding protein